MKSPTTHRKDIQSLRAVAVLLVLFGHLFPKEIPGGFIGVDIFFVISGFVITRQMMKSFDENSFKFLLTFYSRRIGRILPTALLVIISTVFATNYLLGPVTGNQVKLEAGWATIFLSNFYFAHTATDYFALGIQASPLQNFWSLSIEEQFYLVWPTLFLLLMSKFVKDKFRPIFIGSIIFISLFISIYQSIVMDAQIFFSSHSRVWELASGVALALYYPKLKLPRSALYLCFIFLLACGLFLNQSMFWPNLIAIPIVVSTLVLLSIDPRTSGLKILESSILTYVGNLSYCMYLWHWPILIIVKGYVLNFGLKHSLLTIGLTLLFSVLTHHFFEKPIRYSSHLQNKSKTVVKLALIIIVLVSFLFFSSYQA